MANRKKPPAKHPPAGHPRSEINATLRLLGQSIVTALEEAAQAKNRVRLPLALQEIARGAPVTDEHIMWYLSRFHHIPPDQWATLTDRQIYALLQADGLWEEGAMNPSPSEQKNEEKSSDKMPEVVDLDQIASIVHLKKCSMGPYKRRQNDPLPDPDFPREGRGSRDYWRWDSIRPWLVRNFNLPIPEHFPNIFRRN